MKKTYFTCFVAMLSALLLFGCTSGYANMVKKLILPQPTVVKMKLYLHDTVALVWFDVNGDGKADHAMIYEKKNGYFVQEKLRPKQADEIDQFILEPRI